ncbi:MAG: nucleotide sugar dehydrogenase [Methanomicrobiaceae archaeon]|uniref:Udp-glucose dehydrogenase n=1 Tax=hydrocarbon metagenome TaxID=938273 RepID=A0A0W8FJR9_9ZZZZ|nr:nucleotide sugar dehydrogenase [Methanomicrobiaceae archaeon]MDD5420150.1 nucleotide sugar dehydrogenase [Methanomicrobiaceae archaeon]
MKICVLGLGYIGLPTALLFATHGCDVVGCDVKQSVVDSLNNGKIPFDEPGLSDLFIGARRRFTAKTVPEPADVFLIAVPTPLDPATKVSDLTYVRKAAGMIAPLLERDDLVVLESTVPPGTTERLVAPQLEKSGVRAGEFMLAHCPERALPGRTLHEMVYNSRVIGGYDRRSTEYAADLYRIFVRGEIHETDAKTAEFVKLMENTYRDVSIALANEFAQLSEECGVNVWSAIALANKHPRVSILNPGPGVGGHCIAIDPWFLTENSTRCKMISMAREINDSMPNYVLHLIRRLLPGVKDASIAVLGVAYKGNVDDTRESPAIKFIQLAENEGYDVRCYDPYVKDFLYPLLPLDEATAGSDCIVVLADHDCLRRIDPAAIRVRTKNLLDTRHIMDYRRWVLEGFTVRILGDGSPTLPPGEGIESRESGLSPSLSPPAPAVSISLPRPPGQEREDFL